MHFICTIYNRRTGSLSNWLNLFNIKNPSKIFYLLSNLILFNAKIQVYVFIPKNCWDQRWLFVVWAPYEKRNICFLKIFFYYVISFLAIPSMSNSNFKWACGEFLFKMGCKFIFLVFFEKLLHVAMWPKLPKGWRAWYQKRKACFLHRTLGFHFFILIFFAHGSKWCHLQCGCFNLNVKSLISFKKL